MAEHSQPQRRVGIVGMYDDPDSLITAAELVADSGHAEWDCYTPYPVHGLDDAMRVKESPIPYVTLTAGLMGLLAAISLTGGLSALYYPIRIGGKALFSWQAFVPIFFELFVLFAALATMGSVIWFCKLGRWASPLHDSGIMKETICDRFAITLMSCEKGLSEERMRDLLEKSGCKDIRPLMEDEDEGTSLI
jgi:hypothetical protein